MTIDKTKPEVMKLIASKGWDADNLTKGNILWLSAKTRTGREFAKDGVKALTSLAKTTVHLDVVSDDKALENQKICEANECGVFKTLKRSGEPACLDCQCSGRLLKSKWKNKKMSCPRINPATNKPYWTNVELTCNQMPV